MADTINDVATKAAGHHERHGFRAALIPVAPAVDRSVVGVRELSRRDRAKRPV